MEENRSKQVLGKLKYIDNIIREYKLELQSLDEFRSTLCSPRLDVGIGGSSGISDPTGTTVVRLDKLKGEILKKQKELIDIKYKSIRAMNRMTSANGTVLFYYYYKNYTFEQTATAMGLSYQWVWELHRRALREFGKIYSSIDDIGGE